MAEPVALAMGTDTLVVPTQGLRFEDNIAGRKPIANGSAVSHND